MEEQNYIKKALEDKKKMGKTLKIIAIGFAALIIITLLIIVVHLIIDMIYTDDEDSNFFNLIALAIIVVWFGILIAYYAWAIYFYNINLGLTDEDWAEIRERKKHNPEGVNETTENPNINQTLGLPTGTVRGTVALTLLIGAIAMTIAALGMKNTFDTNSFLVDNFDFFKTAFLMMIAFYFGNKSLEMLGYTGKKKDGKDQKDEKDDATKGDTDTLVPAVNEAAGRKKIINDPAKQADADAPAKAGDADFDDKEAML